MLPASTEPFQEYGLGPLVAFLCDTVTFSRYTMNMLPDLVGVDHMVMGSDFPHLLGSIDRGVSSFEGLHIPAVEKERIFSRAALSIFSNLERT